MTAPARIAAWQALRAVGPGRVDLPTALFRSRSHLQDERDRALAADIVTGALRWRRSLDHLVAHYARRPLAKLDGDVLVILQLSLYQLLHLDRVPAAAVVDDAVDLTRAARKASASGFVNAVLRTVLRERHRLPLPPRPSDTADRRAALLYLGVTHSHPEWLVARWLDRYGFDRTEQWVRFNNTAPALTLRANVLRTTRDGVRVALEAEDIGCEPARYAPDGLIVTSGNPLRKPLDGSFFVQDEASQLVPLAVGATPGEHVFDLCAAPGGKSAAMLADMRDTGMLVASDVRPRRVSLLQQTLALAGGAHAHVVHVGASGHLPFRPAFDRVLVDAPCSGLGTVRRDPDIRWRRTEADLEPFAREQRVLLERAAAVVKPGGRLVYATCSSEPDENEQVVEAFLAATPAFAPVDLRDERSPILQPLLDARGHLSTLPFAHGLEAFFAAAFVKR